MAAGIRPASNLCHCYYLKGQNIKLLKLDDKVSETTNKETDRKGKSFKYKRDKYLF